ncbi:MAG: F-box-like domain-containing protein [Simkaniaceae bacterium]
MNNSNMIEVNINYALPEYALPEEEDDNKNFINKLPYEIFSNILSRLDYKDIKSTATVSEYWNEASIDVACRAQYSAIKTYVDAIRNELKEESYGDQKEKLLKIGSDKKILNSRSLIELDSFIKKQKNKLIDTLKSLKEDDLEGLEELVKKQPIPKFFGNLLILAKIYRKIDLAEETLDNVAKVYAFQDISKALAKNGDFDKAIEVALMIPSDYFQGVALQIISMVLVENGDFEKAVEVAEQIPCYRNKCFAFKHIFEVLVIKNDDFDKAIEIAPTISNNNDQARILANDQARILAFISDMLVIKKGDFDKAIKVALMIPDNVTKSRTLLNISEALTKNGDFEKAREVALKAVEFALMIPDNVTKSRTLLNISEALTKNGDFEKAREVALKAVEVALMIPDNLDISYALLHISKALAYSGDYEKAKEVALMIPDNDIKSNALQNISEVLTKNNNKEFE